MTKISDQEAYPNKETLTGNERVVIIDTDDNDKLKSTHSSNLMTDTSSMENNIHTIYQELIDMKNNILVNASNIEKDRVVSLNASFVNAGDNYTANYGVSGGVVHINDGSILQTNKDCMIHYNLGSSDCVVYINKNTKLYKDIETHTSSTITMFNSGVIGIPIGDNPVFTRKEKELNFQAKINRTIFQDTTINSVDYRLYNNVVYDFSQEIGNNPITNDTIVKVILSSSVY